MKKLEIKQQQGIDLLVEDVTFQRINRNVQNWDEQRKNIFQQVTTITNNLRARTSFKVIVALVLNVIAFLINATLWAVLFSGIVLYAMYNLRKIYLEINALDFTDCIFSQEL